MEKKGEQKFAQNQWQKVIVRLAFRVPVEEKKEKEKETRKAIQ